MPQLDPAMAWPCLLLGLLAAGHAWYLLGWKRAALFFGMAFCLAWAAASLSQATALASPLQYTGALGPRIGQVPAAAVLGWSGMLYNSHLIANLVADGRVSGRRRGGTWTVLLALLTALVLTAWDLTLDPTLAGRAWTWTQGGAYFATPFANYLNWLQIGFTVDVAIRLVEPAVAPGLEPAPRALMLRPGLARAAAGAAVPIAAFGAMGLAGMCLGRPEATRLLPPFAMGIPLLAACGRAFKHRRDAGEVRA
jgi:putative membrane protein